LFYNPQIGCLYGHFVMVYYYSISMYSALPHADDAVACGKAELIQFHKKPYPRL